MPVCLNSPRLLRRYAPRNDDCEAVIASEAKQSRSFLNDRPARLDLHGDARFCRDDPRRADRCRPPYPRGLHPAAAARRARPSAGALAGAGAGRAARYPGALPDDPARSRNAGRIRRDPGRRGGRRRLWPHTAGDDPRGAATWLPQCPCLALAALARRRADPARHPGRRQRDRDHDHADGRGARYRADPPAGGDADRARHQAN